MHIRIAEGPVQIRPPSLYYQQEQHQMNYAKLVVDLAHAQTELEKAQRNNNVALMISIADRISRLAQNLSNQLEEATT